MSELRKDDLRFTTAEAAHFLNQMMQLGLTQEQVAMGTVYEGDSSPWENKMFLVDPQGEVVIEHYKYGNAPDEGFKPGDGVLQTVETPFGTLSALICNDTNHQEVVTQAGRNGTDILLSPALEFRGIVPMHAHMAAFRAIENGTTIVRQADNGLSVVIDPYGRTLAAMNHYTTDEHVTVAQVPADSSVFTLYPIISDLFAWLAIAGFVALIVYGIILRRRENDRGIGPGYASLYNWSLPGLNGVSKMDRVEIWVADHLDCEWLDWLGDFDLVHTAENQSILRGQIRDQAALYGLIGKLRDLGVTLISVNYQGQPKTPVQRQ